MNKVIQIRNADRCELVHEGIRYIFVKDKPVEVPPVLADRLLQSGDFVDLVPPITGPAPLNLKQFAAMNREEKPEPAKNKKVKKDGTDDGVRK